MSCSLDSDEREFIENLSWDTDSDDEDFELDNEIFKQHDKEKHLQEESDDETFERYNQAFHSFKRNYMGKSNYKDEKISSVLKKVANKAKHKQSE